jgi:predicted DsbA family dithiol-disulfide isomerase
MRAVQQCENDSTGRSSTFDQLMWAFRRAFFRDCRDISHWDIQCEIAADLGADIGAIEERIHSGAAFAALAADYQDADKMRIGGNPSLCLMRAARSSTEMSGSA